MLTSRFFRAASFASLFILAALVTAAQQESQTATSDELRSNIRKATGPDKARKAYDAFFKHYGPRKLSDLVHDSDMDVAIHASWRLNNVTVPRRGEELSFGVPRGNLEAAHSERFLGFLEGRTRLKIPLWWDIAFRDPVYLLRTPILSKTGLGTKAPDGTSLKRRKRAVLLTVAGSSVRIPVGLLEELKKEQHLDKCTAYVGPEQSFVALYGDSGARFTLLCLNTHTGKLMWRATVWSSARLGGSGSSTQIAELVVNDDLVAVFGICNFDRYVEGFHRKTGVSAFRFKYP